MKRPLLTIAVLYAIGVLIAEFVPFERNSVLCCSGALGVIALLVPKVRPYLLAPLFVLVGAANLTLHKAVLSPFDLRVLLGEKPELVTVQGRLVGPPTHRSYGVGGAERWRTVGQIEVVSLRRAGLDFEHAVGRVAFSVNGLLGDEYCAGALVEVTGVIGPPRGPVAHGAFDLKQHLARRGIYYQLRVTSTNDWRLLQKPDTASVQHVCAKFIAWAKAALAVGLPAEDEPLQLVRAMTLGLRDVLTDDVALPFMRSGTMHIFAISGLHIALIAGMLVTLLRVAQIPRRICGAVVIPLLWFYTAATGWLPSAVRATVMMSVVILGWMSSRPSDVLNSLGAAALLILIADPLQLFQASFQLSFAVVLSIALLTGRFRESWHAWTAPDPLLPDKLRPRWHQWLLRAGYWLGTALATSLAAWLGSAPIIAHYFNLVTPVTLVVNVIVVPLAGLALASALGGIITAAWFPACATLFNHSAWFWTLLVSKISEAAAELPFGHFYVQGPPLLAFIFYYGVLLAALSGWLKKRELRRGLVCGLGAIGVAALIQWLHEHSAPRLTVLPLAGGHAVYFDSGLKGQDLLVDCGSAAAAESVLEPFLRGRGVDRLDTFVLTHGHANQIGGACFVADRFRPVQIATNRVPFRSRVYAQTIAQLSGYKAAWRSLSEGDTLGPWRVIHPRPDDRFQQADDAALVMYGTIRGTRVLLLSDLGWWGQKILIERNENLEADILVAGLPADSQAVADSLLEKVKPKLVVIADSELPATRRAPKELRRRLAGRQFTVIYTSQVGAVEVTLTNGKWSVRTALELFAEQHSGGAEQQE
ncbi:MAG: ComEC/Rec2 family competence protein [Verrucomicrobiae bacterium]|nr:ComEC/Rec2 family competence protein [Verrucomicrobiae bacterium]MCX7721489.1 ComEC/Rec2 family competence protein [Verrucomicrobiae bacterium]